MVTGSTPDIYKKVLRILAGTLPGLLAIGFTVCYHYSREENAKRIEFLYDNIIYPDWDQDVLSIEVMIETSMDSRLQNIET